VISFRARASNIWSEVQGAMVRVFQKWCRLLRSWARRAVTARAPGSLRLVQ